MNNKLAWFIMEFVVLLQMLFFLFTGSKRPESATLIIAGFFVLHYVNRSIIFPLRLRTSNKKMPVAIMLSAVAFNLVNGFQIGYYLSHFANYTIEYLWSAKFISGAIIFFTGFFINQWSDSRLINLRKANDVSYQIPQGGLFNYVSCPNHLGEFIEWFGFAVLCWNLPALSFFIWTVCNVLPRSLDHHKWYLKKFSDYPTERKAVLPGVL